MKKYETMNLVNQTEFDTVKFFMNEKLQDNKSSILESEYAIL